MSFTKNNSTVLAIAWCNDVGLLPSFVQGSHGLVQKEIGRSAIQAEAGGQLYAGGVAQDKAIGTLSDLLVNCAVDTALGHGRRLPGISREGGRHQSLFRATTLSGCYGPLGERTRYHHIASCREECFETSAQRSLV